MSFHPSTLVSLIIPTGICMAWVGLSEYLLNRNKKAVKFDTYQVTEDNTTGGKISNAVVLSLVFVGVAVVITLLMVLCVKYQWNRLLKGFLGLTTLFEASMVSLIYARTVLIALDMPIDMLSFFFATYNFVTVMVISICLSAPQILRKIFQVVNIGLIAILFLRIPYSTYFAWIFLAIFALYDLIAVLCPFGPLNLLLGAVKNEGGKLPKALVYSAGDVPMVEMRSAEDSPPPDEDSSPPEDVVEEDHSSAEEPETPAPKRGSQLGLGDFFFYSLLVGKVALTGDLFAAIAVIISLLDGLIIISTLVVKFDRPLPALPIAVALALLVSAICIHCVTPFSHLRELHQLHL